MGESEEFWASLGLQSWVVFVLRPSTGLGYVGAVVGMSVLPGVSPCLGHVGAILGASCNLGYVHAIFGI